MQQARVEVKKDSFAKSFQKHWMLYLMVVPALLYVIIFCYKPMYGILIAFKKFNYRDGIMGSPWIGFDNFRRIFSSYWFPIIFKNTLTLSFMGILFGFPLPIVFALLVNEIKNSRAKKIYQTISYAPHFISTVVVCGMILMFLSTEGVVNTFLDVLGLEAQRVMQNPSAFKWVNFISGEWQELGWGSIIYLSALSNVDPQCTEAACIDGANRFQRMIHINFPVLIPTISIMLILRFGQVMSLGYEKIYLLQNSANLYGSEIISTYVYKVGLEQGDFGFSTAVSLMNSLVNVILLLTVNKISAKVSNNSLF